MGFRQTEKLDFFAERANVPHTPRLSLYFPRGPVKKKYFFRVFSRDGFVVTDIRLFESGSSTGVGIIFFRKELFWLLKIIEGGSGKKTGITFDSRSLQVETRWGGKQKNWCYYHISLEINHGDDTRHYVLTFGKEKEDLFRAALEKVCILVGSLPEVIPPSIELVIDASKRALQEKCAIAVCAFYVIKMGLKKDVEEDTKTGERNKKRIKSGTQNCQSELKEKLEKVWDNVAFFFMLPNDFIFDDENTFEVILEKAFQLSDEDSPPDDFISKIITICEGIPEPSETLYPKIDK